MCWLCLRACAHLHWWKRVHVSCFIVNHHACPMVYSMCMWQACVLCCKDVDWCKRQYSDLSTWTSKRNTIRVLSQYVLRVKKRSSWSPLRPLTASHVHIPAATAQSDKARVPLHSSPYIRRGFGCSSGTYWLSFPSIPYFQLKRVCLCRSCSSCPSLPHILHSVSSAWNCATLCWFVSNTNPLALLCVAMAFRRANEYISGCSRYYTVPSEAWAS